MINLVLIEYIVVLIDIIKFILSLLMGKNLLKNISDEPVKKEYQKLQVDEQPIFEIPQRLDYKILLAAYQDKHHKELKPVNQRKNRPSFNQDVMCPRCSAPHNYLYDNNGGRGQFSCKVCKTNFNPKNYYQKSVVFKCPHCSANLERIKDRKDFHIHKCRNDKCSFYTKNLNSMIKSEKLILK